MPQPSMAKMSMKIGYSRVPLWCGPIYQDITYGAATTATERQSDFKLTTHTPYLVLTGELYGVYYENL